MKTKNTVDNVREKNVGSAENNPSLDTSGPILVASKNASENPEEETKGPQTERTKS